jgi:heat shock protein HtpX
MSGMMLEEQHNASRPSDGGGLLGNYAQVIALLTGFGGLLAAVFWPAYGQAALIISFISVAAVFALALRTPAGTLMHLYGARLYEAGDREQLDRITKELSNRAGLPRAPRLYVVPSMLLSAFSVGNSEQSAVALTEGLLRRLTMRELAAVLAQQVAHVQRGDLLAFGVADIVSRCAQVLYYVGLLLAALNLLARISGDPQYSWFTVVLLILAPVLMSMLQMTLSRQREFEVDRAAALLTGDPLGAASAISRLDAPAGTPLDEILPPVPARKVPLPSMLRYPPPSEQRIARLNTFNAPPMPPLDIAEGPRISLIGVGPIEMRPRYRWCGVWF